jgi:hypothetical protein
MALVPAGGSAPSRIYRPGTLTDERARRLECPARLVVGDKRVIGLLPNPRGRQSPQVEEGQGYPLF